MASTRVCRECGQELMGSRCQKCLMRLALGEEELSRPVSSASLGEPPLEPDTDFLRIQVIGDYEILQEIGRGGMGVVYKARQISLNRLVALKRILSQKLATPDILLRFQVETEAIAQLDHANIVPLYETAEHHGIHFYTMRLLDGGSLADRLHRCWQPGAPTGTDENGGERTHDSTAETRRKLRELVGLLAKVCRGIHHAHQRGILHRDLKPTNILLDTQSEPYVSDFGLAKCLENDAALTQTETLLGSPAYMAPEQASGYANQVSTAADIYSLGAILYEILTGQPPFRGPTAFEIMRKVVEEVPQRPQSLNPRVDRDIETVCLRCLEKDPAKRYGSVQELAEDLDRWLADRPVLARPVSPIQHLLRWGNRNRALALASVLSVILLITLAAGSMVAAWRIDSANRRTEALLERMQLEKAEAYFSSDQAGHGLAMLAHVLRKQPARPATVSRLLSALQSRPFGLTEWTPLQTQSLLVHRMYEPESNQVVTVGKDGRLVRWSLVRCEPIETIQSLGKGVAAADSDRRNGLVAVGFKDGTARLIRLNAPAELVELPRSSEPVRLLQFSQGGDRMIIVSGRTNYCVIETGSGQLVGAPQQFPGLIRQAMFSPDDRTILVTGESGVIHLRNASTLDMEQVLKTDGWPNFSAAFSPDSRRIAAGSLNGSVWMWDLKRGVRVQADFKHERFVGAVAFDRDGRMVASGSADGSARFHDPETGGVRGQWMRHRDTIGRVEFCAGSCCLLTAGNDNAVRLWSAPTGEPITEPMPHLTGVEDATFMGGHRRLVASCYDGTVWTWRITGAGKDPITVRHRGPVTQVKLSADGTRILSASRDRTARLLDAHTGSERLVLRHEAAVTAAVFDAVGDWAATGDEQGNILVWDGVTGERIRSWKTGLPMVWRLEFDSERHRLLAIHGDRMIRIYPLSGTNESVVAIDPGATVMDLKFYKTGEGVLTAAVDGHVTLWNSDDGGKRIRSPRLGGAVSTVEAIPGTDRILYAGGYAARICDLFSHTPIHVFLHEMNVRSAVLSPDSRLVATASFDRSAAIWRVGAAEPLQAKFVHPGRVVAVEFSPDSKSVLTICEDDGVRVWDTGSGQLLAEPFKHGSRVAEAHFSPDGTCVVTGAQDGLVRIWTLPKPDPAIVRWLPEAAEYVSRRRVTPEGRETAIPSGELIKKRAALEAGGVWKVLFGE